MDRASIVFKGDKVQVWTKTIFKKPVEIRDIRFKADGQMSLHEFDCRDRTHIFLSHLYREPGGDSFFMPGGTTGVVSHVEPDSVFETIMKTACAPRK
jgi:hypothetical protein